ncbi:MAG: ASCH domain-containing protein [Alphaproteobacteria bacterium]|nr:ASCH domain-containing protein [Alphaproteobacteria bacterium]MBL7099680.1 ASCH domain-containing protein [Alphaproteobacteria bacterium]
MHFIEKLREPIRRGEITTSIRIWQRPHVKVGGIYAMEGGRILVTAMTEIEIRDITPKMARDSGFNGLADLLKTAKHGSGERVFLVEFEFQPSQASQRKRPTTGARRRAK